MADASTAWRNRLLGIVVVLSAIYVISMFLRSSVTVIAPDLAMELHLTAGDLGFLGSTYFLAFALAQIPAGIAIDRIGSRLTITGSTFVAVLGCVLFAASSTAGGLAIARALIGLGCASTFMASIAVFSRWIAKDRLSTVTGLQLGIGTLGSLNATTPFALLVGLIGWRMGFVIVAVATAAVALLVLAVVRDAPPAGLLAARPRETLRATLAGVVEAAKTPSALRLALLQFAAYPSFATIQTLWGGPWLADVYGMDRTQRSHILFLMVAAQAAGLFLWGPADRVMRSFKIPVAIGAAASVVLLLIAAIVRLPEGSLTAWMIAFGFATAFLPVMVAHGRALFPDRLIGRGITFINVGTMAGAFLLQYLAGKLIGLYPGTAGDGRIVYPAEAYEAMFLMLACVLGAALAVYAGARDFHRGEASERDSSGSAGTPGDQAPDRDFPLG